MRKWNIGPFFCIPAKWAWNWNPPWSGASDSRGGEQKWGYYQSDDSSLDHLQSHDASECCRYANLQSQCVEYSWKHSDARSRVFLLQGLSSQVLHFHLSWIPGLDAREIPIVLMQKKSNNHLPSNLVLGVPLLGDQSHRHWDFE